jgi:mannose-6-phosphate isomerase-like protein (cupin superfamily)
MKLHNILLAAALLVPAAAFAQTAPDMKTIAHSADVQALIAKAKTMPPKPLISQNIVGATPYRANLEYRTGPAAPASIHDKENELMYVVEGSGTLTLGGTLVDGTRSNPTNQSGSSITGGTPNHIAKGDFIIVPAGTAHQIAADGGMAIALMTFHMPSTWPTP